jgi:VanZ family protein
VHNKFLLATVVWVVFITYACLAGASNIPEASWLNIPNKDKIVHFVFYFVLTLLLSKDYRVKSISTEKAWLYAFVTAVSYGVVIEIFQGLFTAERSAEVLDVVANTSGSALAIFTLWLFGKRKK